MLIYDDIYHWKGWGGKLGLASGSCRLRIFDQKREQPKDLVMLRPVVVIVSDVPGWAHCSNADKEYLKVP